MPLRLIAVFSLVFTYLFFFEYAPPFRWMDIPHDLQYFHYPLDDFAFQSLRHGHIPEWDPTMYCGMTFIGNSQAALFYPPMWVVFLVNIGHDRLKYRNLEMLVLAHVWLAFLFCFMWLRARGLRDLACTLGAGVFAYSGYLMLQLSHLGTVCVYAWIPVGFLSIDQAVTANSWRPLWKLVLAGAFCIFAGHPPAAFVFFMFQLAYAALGRRPWKALTWTAAALALSTEIALVQILPTWEATLLREFHEAYGAGIRDPMFYVSYIIPNFYAFGLNTSVWANRGFEYLYLGAPGIFAILWTIAHPALLVRSRQILGVGVLSAIMVTNPYDLVWNVIRHSDVMAQICRSWYFLSGITLAVAGLTAYAVDDILHRNWHAPPRWTQHAATLFLIGWPAWLLWKWRPGGAGFASGWAGALEPAVMLVAFSFCLYARTAPALTVALLLALGVDYKVFGTSMRLNGYPGNSDHIYSRGTFPGLNETVYREIHSHPEYRVGLDRDDPVPMDLRHSGLTTPQGGDPLAPAQYHKVLPPTGAYYGPLVLAPSDEPMLRLLAVRYFLTGDSQPLFPKLKADPNFRLMEPSNTYMKAFEYRNAQPSYRWEQETPGDGIERTAWSAEKREFVARTQHGGRFILIEQMEPGWEAAIDGKITPVERWHTAFQSVLVPAGQHRVRFEYRSRAFRTGAVLSSLFLIALGSAFLQRK